MSNFDFKALSDSVRDVLLADPFFASIPATSGEAVVISEDPHDIPTLIEAALNNIGIGMLVLLPVAKVTNPNLKGPVFDDVRIVIKIYENPTVNRAASTNGGNNPTCYAAAMQAAADLHYPDGWEFDPIFVVEAIPVADDTFNIYQVTLKTSVEVIGDPLPPIAPVTLSSLEPGNIALACATPGAPIFYTLDGTYPSPRQGTLYTEPVAVAAGQMLRARAWLPGYGAPQAPNSTETNQQY